MRTADLLRVVYSIATVLLVVLGDINGAVHFLLVSIVVWGTRSIRVPPGYELVFVTALAIEGVGNTVRLFDLQLVGPIRYDDVAHVMITGAAAAFAFAALRSYGILPALSPIGTAIVIIGLAAALGAGFEIYEYIVNTLWPGPGPLGVSYGDTIGDLTTDLVGGSIASVMVLKWGKGGL